MPVFSELDYHPLLHTLLQNVINADVHHLCHSQCVGVRPLLRRNLQRVRQAIVSADSGIGTQDSAGGHASIISRTVISNAERYDTYTHGSRVGARFSAQCGPGQYSYMARCRLGKTSRQKHIPKWLLKDESISQPAGQSTAALENNDSVMKSEEIHTAGQSTAALENNDSVMKSEEIHTYSKADTQSHDLGFSERMQGLPTGAGPGALAADIADACSEVATRISSEAVKPMHAPTESAVQGPVDIVEEGLNDAPTDVVMEPANMPVHMDTGVGWGGFKADKTLAKVEVRAQPTDCMADSEALQKGDGAMLQDLLLAEQVPGQTIVEEPEAPCSRLQTEVHGQTEVPAPERLPDWEPVGQEQS